jgi:hypothetical protein
MMKHRLLTSVAIAGLMSFAATAWADETANNNAGSAITQNSGPEADAIASGGNAVDDGAYTGGGNALGNDANHNAAADTHSTAVQLTTGSGVANFGSGFNVGNGNEGASSAEGGAAATGSSVAVATHNWISDGSASVIGDQNLTAAAHDGGAALGANGTAVGISEVNVNAEDVTAAFGEGNVVAGAHLEEVNTVSTDLTFGEAELGIAGFFFAKAHLAGALAYGPNASVTTGNINNQTLGSLSGANMVAGNTGVANQGDSIGIAANNSF